jgi:hypothetical protein
MLATPPKITDIQFIMWGRHWTKIRYKNPKAIDKIVERRIESQTLKNVLLVFLWESYNTISLTLGSWTAHIFPTLPYWSMIFSLDFLHYIENGVQWTFPLLYGQCDTHILWFRSFGFGNKR